MIKLICFCHLTKMLQKLIYKNSITVLTINSFKLYTLTKINFYKAEESKHVIYRTIRGQ
jgi:hypothetical protein